MYARADGADRRRRHRPRGGRRRLRGQRHAHPDPPRGRQDRHPQRGGRPQGHLQAHAPGRPAHGRQREADDPQALLRARPLRPRLRRAPQDQQEARPLRPGAGGAAHAPRERHRGHRGDPPAPQDLHGPRAGGRHRPPRQPPRPHDGRAAGEPVPRGPRPHGAPHPRAHDDPRRAEPGAAHAPAPRQLQDVLVRDLGLLQPLAAEPVHGPDEPALRPRPQAPPLGPRPRRPLPRARGLRGARRPPLALRPHLPDRDAGRPEHRPHLLARPLREDQQVRLHRDPVPRRARRQGDGHGRVPARRRGGAVRHRPGERAAQRGPDVRREEGDVPLPHRVLRQARRRGPVHGRRADAGHLHRRRPHPVP